MKIEINQIWKFYVNREFVLNGDYHLTCSSELDNLFHSEANNIR